jgi:hypothetical protein
MKNLKTIIASFLFMFITVTTFAQPIDVVNNFAGKDGQTVGLVGCATSKEPRPCTLDDLISTMSKTAAFIITIILPVVFFYGLFMTLWPVFKGPDNPANIAEAKSRFIKLLIGTAIVAGAYVIVKGVLLSIGVNQTDTIQKVINTKNALAPHFNYLSFISGTAYAQSGPLSGNAFNNTGGTGNTGPLSGNAFNNGGTSSSPTSGGFQNPLENVTVQGVISGIINSIIFIAILGNVYMYFRAAFLFLNGQQNPVNLVKARWWFGAAVAVSLIVFGAQTIYSIVEGTIKSVFTT